jgi:SAM-dependent methyltransferase
MTGDAWTAGEAYEEYVGRWSREVAARFVPWLDVPARRRWLDVGCGTGALTSAARAGGGSVVGVDPSRAFVAGARDVVVGDALALPFAAGAFDAVVSGLALNFVPSPREAMAELKRVTAPGGTVAAYVWDYADGMAMIRHFWDAALELDPAAPDEGARFPLCQPSALTELWRVAGLTGVQVRAIVVSTVFADFDAYWRPFLGGQGPAPGYLASLSPPARESLRSRLQARLPASDIRLTARAWAVRGMMA